MYSNALFLSLVALTAANPINDGTFELHETPITDGVSNDLQNEINNAIYKQNFKVILMSYVLNEYKNLTFAERSKVEDIIENLLEDVAKDFKVILNDDTAWTEDAVARFGDPSFEKIHSFIHLQLPDLKENNVIRLAYRLESNLLIARQKIERVIKESKKAYVENS